MKKHLLYYPSLCLVLLVGFSMTFYLSGNVNLQLAIIVLTAFLYACWGIIHHLIHHSFSLKIMLEYIAIAILGISIVFFVLRIAL